MARLRLAVEGVLTLAAKFHGADRPSSPSRSRGAIRRTAASVARGSDTRGKEAMVFRRRGEQRAQGLQLRVDGGDRPGGQGVRAISWSLRTVRQLRAVVMVLSLESKYCEVSLLRATPFGQRR